jgi:CDP-paratose 2-epimerase
VYNVILVTGGAGFAGSSLAVRLAREFPGTRVLTFDNLKRLGSERNLGRLREAGVQFVHGDVRQLSDLMNLSVAPELIVECSGEPSAQAGYGGSPDYLIQTNLAGCYHCLELARLTKADFLFLSTSRVYPYSRLNSLHYSERETRYVLTPQTVAGASEMGISEEFCLDGPRSLYGTTKLASELLLEEFSDAYGFRYVIDRFGLLTGPYQMARSDQGVIALWVAAHCHQRPLAYIGFGGTGKQVRDVLHVDDFCDLVLDQILHFDRYQGRRWNVGGGVANSLSLFETTRLCQEVTGRKIPISSMAENRPADLRIYITDHSRVSAVHGWSPKRDVRQCVTDIANWIDQAGDSLQAAFWG